MTVIKRQNNAFTGCLCALGCEILYGLSYIFTKQATESVSAFALLGWRFFIAAIIINICVLLGVIKINIHGKPIKSILSVALFSPCIYYIAETLGISNTTASESGVFLACIPVVSLVASTLILKKKPSKTQITGILFTLAGVIVTVFAASEHSSLSLTGYISLLIAVISYALYSVFVDKAYVYTEAEITFVMLMSGAVLFIFLAFAEAASKSTISELLLLPFKNKNFIIAVLYQSIGCSVLAFFLSNAAISRIGVNRTSSFIGASTVVSIIAGALFLNESFTKYQLLGAVVIIIGVYTANIKLKHNM